jgi:hypothetical protein
MAEIDERYKRGMIYTIRNIKDDTMIYVGSTINNLSKRFDAHKRKCKSTACSNISLFEMIENNDWSDWYIELYEAYPCNNKRELERREGEVIRQIGTINKCIVGRTGKEYRDDNANKIKENKKKYREENIDKEKARFKKWYKENADKIKDNAKKYREDNVDKIKEKVCCDICGLFVRKDGLTRHQKSKSCISKTPNNIGTHTDNHI